MSACLPACERIHRVTRHSKANKASALAKLGEETAECDKALELFNATELQQVGGTCDTLRAVILQDTFLFWKAPLTVFARRIRRCRSGRLSSTRSRRSSPTASSLKVLAALDSKTAIAVQ